MTPWVRRLIVANLLVQLLRLTIFSGDWFVAQFGFAPADAFARPWTFLTYMFLHGGLLHLLFNMLLLFWVGSPVEEKMGSRGFISYYLVCGLGGAVLSMTLQQGINVGITVGASGAIFGVLLAFAWFWPDQQIMVFPLPTPIPVKWLVVFLVGFSFVLAWVGGGDVAHLAHLGGFAAGFVYLKAQELRLSRAERHLRRVAEPSVLVHPAATAVRGAPTAPRGRRPAARDAIHAEIDRVLDKISARGMASLTPAERKFLSEMSRKMPPRE
ncbi:MAG TPA: rhomboid family intramembrane serine protease [Gemmatimonadales bacterium]